MKTVSVYDVSVSYSIVNISTVNVLVDEFRRLLKILI